jgi:hypothetical protein
MANFAATYYEGGDLLSMTQSPAAAVYYAPSQVTTVVYTNVRYWQRVYSSGLSAWCYYSTLNATNPTPLSSETTPNWTGSISNFQVVQAVIEAP